MSGPVKRSLLPILAELPDRGRSGRFV